MAQQDPYSTLGTAIRERRAERGWSADTLAHHAWTDGTRVTGSQITQFERGVKRPRLPVLTALVRVLWAEGSYPPAVAVHLLRLLVDEREVGQQQALENYARLRTGDAEGLLGDGLIPLEDGAVPELDPVLKPPAEEDRPAGRKHARQKKRGRA